MIISLDEALHWLYLLETYYKNLLGDDTFYGLRDASSEGVTEGGLIYARGLVTHRDATPAELVLVHGPQIGIHRAGGRRGGGIAQAARPMVAEAVWRPLADFPQPGPRKRHERDRFYDEHVANRPASDPLDDALAFVLGLRPD